MASSSKNISMPLVFAISVGSVFAMIASTVFGMAWYAFENRKVINARVDTSPMHSKAYEAKYGAADDSQQSLNLQCTGTQTIQLPGEGFPTTHVYTPIDQAMRQIVAANTRPAEHDDDHGHDDHGGHHR